MSTIGEIEAAISILERAGLSRNKITILHCTSEYPTNMPDVNLLAMQTIGTTFGTKFGYSDHTLGIEIPIAAVALGATVIEKHFTLNRGMEGPDHNASLEPHELNEMVRSIRNIETALGDGLKRPTATELKNSKSIRKSIVAINKIKKGEAFSIHNIGAKRPGTGISPMKWNDLLGKKSTKSYDVDELINYD
jgi:N,N'-diacetyllegionaminate synthase